MLAEHPALTEEDLENLTEDPEPHVRFAALRALIRRGQPQRPPAPADHSSSTTNPERES
jgi:HEAT repeat protein